MTVRGTRVTADRGVSEVLAFILVFGLIMGSVTLVYAFGFPAMFSYQEAEQVQNAERAFDAMAETFNDVLRYGGVEERSSEITLREGTLSIAESPTVLEIGIDGSPPSGIDASSWNATNSTLELGSLVYTKEDSTVAYEGGGVFRGAADGNTVVRRPQITCRGDVAIVSLVNIEANEQSLFSAESQEITIQEEQTWTASGSEVTLAVESSSYDRGWELALERGGEWDESGGTYTCDAEDAVLRITTVDIDY